MASDNNRMDRVVNSLAEEERREGERLTKSGPIGRSSSSLLLGAVVVTAKITMYHGMEP